MADPTLFQSQGPKCRRQMPRWMALLGGAAFALAGCGPGGHYSRLSLSNEQDAAAADGLASIDGSASGGSGGTFFGSGGVGGGGIGSGGMTGGNGGTTDTASGGTVGTGGRGSGGVPGTGGMLGTGGASTGGRPGTGGANSGGAGSGGAPGTGGAGARIISIDFAGTQIQMAAGERAGVKAATNWNCAPANSGSVADLMDGSANSTGAGLTWSSNSAYRLNWTDVPGDTRMMNGYLDPSSGNASVTVSGLPSSFRSAGYDVYVYVYGFFSTGNRTSNYTIGSTTTSFMQSGPMASSFPGYALAPSSAVGGNYIVFRNLTGASFTLTATAGPSTNTAARAPVNGLQIVSPSGS